MAHQTTTFAPPSVSTYEIRTNYRTILSGMGRPALPLGTHGKIGFTVDDGPPRRVRARTYMRDFDGVVRQVTKFGPSKAAAERALKLALRDRVAPGQSDITGETRVDVLANRWLAELPADRSPNTRETYTYVIARHIAPAVGALRVREMSTPAVDRVLRAVTASSGPGGREDDPQRAVRDVPARSAARRDGDQSGA